MTWETQIGCISGFELRLEATVASEALAFKSNMHMDIKVIEVAQFKIKVNFDVRDPLVHNAFG